MICCSFHSKNLGDLIESGDHISMTSCAFQGKMSELEVVEYLRQCELKDHSDIHKLLQGYNMKILESDTTDAKVSKGEESEETEHSNIALWNRFYQVTGGQPIGVRKVLVILEEMIYRGSEGNLIDQQSKKDINVSM